MLAYVHEICPVLFESSFEIPVCSSYVEFVTVHSCKSLLWSLNLVCWFIRCRICYSLHMLAYVHEICPVLFKSSFEIPVVSSYVEFVTIHTSAYIHGIFPVLFWIYFSLCRIWCSSYNLTHELRFSYICWRCNNKSSKNFKKINGNVRMPYRITCVYFFGFLSVFRCGLLISSFYAFTHPYFFLLFWVVIGFCFVMMKTNTNWNTNW